MFPNPEVVYSLRTADFDFGNPAPYLTKAFPQDTGKRVAQEANFKYVWLLIAAAQEATMRLQNILRRNTFGRSGVDEPHVIGNGFPQQLFDIGRQLSEGCPMRGLSKVQD
jgi:hypothetical protein